MTRHAEPPRRIDAIEPGYFKLRMVKNGPWVAARISHGTITGWWASIGGDQCGPPSYDPFQAVGVSRIWETGTPITEDEYRQILAAPPSSPRLPVDIGSEPPAF